MHAAGVLFLGLALLLAVALVALPFLDFNCAVAEMPIAWEKTPLQRARIRLEAVEMGLAADRAFVARAEEAPLDFDPDLVGEARKRIESGERAAARFRAEVAGMEAAR
jgi:hypothetical protein